MRLWHQRPLRQGRWWSPSYNPPFVDTPIIVSITDWGDVSHLLVTITARSPYYSERREYLGGGVERFYWRSHWGTYFPALTDSVTVTVPRRSGPPPTDDVVQVNIAEIAALGYDRTWTCCPRRKRITNDLRFVSLLRSELLSNDACEIGIDCSDPDQWPMYLEWDQLRAYDGCRIDYPHLLNARYRNQRNILTSQGVVRHEPDHIQRRPQRAPDRPHHLVPVQRSRRV